MSEQDDAINRLANSKEMTINEKMFLSISLGLETAKYIKS